ncbi:hypothetical protein [Nocardia coubleae]|uniref:Uncharacterized protein n=1 Tax=Nocardia coubleae TaxID=356147 RepID=A0A846W519_9NOCA|nr:hypothetical protein [Nocardia coubleae]NKX87836.1 hypothetical protein [Nocardia coubleae]
MAPPADVLTWDLSHLPAVATSAGEIADAIVAAAGTMHNTIHNGLIWKGDAKTAAEDKADEEQTQMRAIAVAYDDLEAACNGAYQAMNQPLADIKTIYQNYVTGKVSVTDDWSVHGVDDWNSEAGIQLARLPGLASALMTADATWGQKLADANSELDRMAPASALAATAAAITAIKNEDPSAIPDSIAASPASHWAPDKEAMTAAAIAGAMTEGTRMGLESAAKDAADKGVLKWVENWGKWGQDGKWTSGIGRLGIVGNVIGTVPAIANDINGGMDPTEAIVSESAGTAAGMAVGTMAGTAVGSWATGALTGAAVGSVVPGAGTAVGFVVGAGVGALTAWGVSKSIQKFW